MKLRQALLSLSFIFTVIVAQAQNSVGIGVANPNKNAVLELISPGNNQGVLIPKLTTAQRTATSFVGGLTTKENGLMVFDSDEKKFYYWDASAWKEMGTGGGNFTSGDGIMIAGTTISTIPQDLEISGGTLKITGNSTTTPISLTDLNIPQDVKITGTTLTVTNNPSATPINLADLNIPQDIKITGSTLTVTNNPSATPIDLSDLNIPQDIKITGSTLTVTNNPSATPINLSDLNIPQDLELTGSTLKITNNPSATPVNLAAFTGTNTDDQTLTYDGATGDLAISRLSGGPMTVNIPLPPATTPPSGSAGGDLTGNYPNPNVANNAITSAKIADGTIAGADILDGTVASADITDGTVASVDITDLTIANADISTTAGISVTKLAPGGTNGFVLTTVAGAATWVAAPTATGTAGGDLTGNYPNPDIAANAVTTAEILDGTVASADITDLTIANADISATAGIGVTKLAPGGTNGFVLTTVAGAAAWVAAPTATGTAGGDLTGNYPNPDIAANAVTTAEILDGTVASADITDGTIASVDIADGTVASVDITDGTVASIDITDNTITTADILDNTVSTADILDNTVASNDITDLTITNADINAAAAILVSKLAPSGTPGQVLTTVGPNTQWANAPTASGTAGGDLTGNYPNPDIAANAVTTAEINDLTITNTDISTTAGIAVAKLAPAGTNGFVLTTTATTAVWAAPGASALISAPGTANLVAGAPMAGIAGSTDNAFFGSNAGNTATTGSWNVAVGSQAGQRMDEGTLNVLIGWQAGFANTTNTFNGNTFIGAEAGKVATGGPNTFIGEKSGSATSTGTENVFVGNQAGLAVTTGGRNTIVGYQANVVGANTQNSIAIGYQTVVDANNKIRLGNAGITVIEGAVAFSNPSDRRLKSNIRPIEVGLDLIMKLKPVSYNMKNSDDTRRNWGFIAQEVQSLVGDTNAVLTVSENKDKTLALRYSDFVAPLVKAVQEQQVQITDLNEKLSESEKKIEVLMAEIEQIKKAVGLKANK